MPSTCHGNGAEHCCWFQGVQCPFVEENTMPGRRWACGLARELGGFPIADDPRWQETVRPMAEAAGLPTDYLCANWPQAYGIKQCCWAEDT